jgi:hypothetical protein
MVGMASLEKRIGAIEARRVLSRPKPTYEQKYRAEYFVGGQWLDGWDIDAIDGETFDSKMANVVHATLHGLVISPESRYKARFLLDLYESVASMY